MSLTTLTFNSANSATNERAGKGKVMVIKTEKFVGSEEVCVIGRLVEGAVFKKMSVSGRDGCQVVSVESKYGDGLCEKQGAQVVLMVSGINKDDYIAGSELAFERMVQEKAKQMGRVIIA